MNLEELNYPLFKLNWWDKILLKKAKKCLEKEEGRKYLCIQLWDDWFSTSLKRKIDKSLSGCFTLDVYLSSYNSIDVDQSLGYKYRVVWINKLLEHNK
jgi:hypothetical protein